jgi:heme-degrading monooxygenase HmoA
LIAVIFEVEFKPGKFDAYYDIAVSLRAEVEKIDGFISIERFASVTNEGKYVSISYWRDAQAIADWKAHADHAAAQDKGKSELFSKYHIYVAEVTRDYGMSA